MPSIAIPVSLRGQLLTSSGFSPASIFSTSEPGIWLDPSDLTTMYQDRAGSTAVTTPGQSVGLRLDKSKGLVLGSELVTNGTFDADTSWNKETGWSISGGSASKASGTGGSLYQGAAAMVQGRTYQITFTVSGYSAGTLTPFCRGTAGTGVTANGTYTQRLIAGADSVYAINFFAGATFAGTIDNISVKELPGNHAVANSDAARGIYGIEPVGGRRNELLQTSFSGAVVGTPGTAPTSWSLAVSGGSITSVSGGVIGFSATANRQIIVQTANIPATGTTTLSVTVASNPDALVFNQLFTVVALPAGATTVLKASGATVAGSTYVPLANERLEIVVTSGSTSGAAGFRIGVGTGGAVTGSASFEKPQFELGSTATAYQRVTDQYDVTEAGKQTIHYVQYDGSDDGYVTPTITPGTDKVQVFAGVRKLSDAVTGVVMESSTSSTLNDGTLWLLAPASSGANSYSFRSRGTFATSISGSGFTAPITNVLTGIGDISGDVARLRVNAVQVAFDTTTDQGTGNFLAYPLYIGRRGGTTLPFNGRDYGIITRFGANLDASTIAATESWLNQKTGAF